MLVRVVRVVLYPLLRDLQFLVELGRHEARLADLVLTLLLPGALKPALSLSKSSAFETWNSTKPAMPRDQSRKAAAGLPQHSPASNSLCNADISVLTVHHGECIGSVRRAF
jgi:hypothetical protein